MAVPKRRMSRSNTRSRRAQWKAEKPELVGVTVAGQKHKVPRRLLKAARLGLIDLDRRYTRQTPGAPLTPLSGARTKLVPVRILVVGDDRAVRESLLKSLSITGHQVEFA